MTTTKSLKKCELEAKWYLIDATNCTLGRLAVFAANILRGKNKPTWTPNMDCGDHVIIINADKVALTGHKDEKTKFFWHSLWTGSTKSIGRICHQSVTAALENRLACAVGVNQGIAYPHFQLGSHLVGQS